MEKEKKKEDSRALSNRRECSRGRRLQRLQVVTDPPVGIRPEINSHTPWEKLFRVRFSPSLSFPPARQAFSYSLLLRAAPSLFLPALHRVSLTLPTLRQSFTNGTYRLDAHNQARKRRSCAIESSALASLLYTRVRHGTVSIAIPNTRSSCLDFNGKNTNSKRGKYENERDTIVDIVLSLFNLLFHF